MGETAKWVEKGIGHSLERVVDEGQGLGLLLARQGGQSVLGRQAGRVGKGGQGGIRANFKLEKIFRVAVLISSLISIGPFQPLCWRSAKKR